MQVDTVALYGGDMGGNFFWGLTVTDRLTQWTELRGVWNRGAAATKDALADAEAAFPFPLTATRTTTSAWSRRTPPSRASTSATGASTASS